MASGPSLAAGAGGSFAPHERLALTGLLVALAGVWLLGPLPAAVQAGLLAAAVVVSLSHGGADIVVARRLLRPRLGRWWLPLFGLGYLVLAGLALLLWWLSPLAALAGFLTVSVLHFGETDWPAPGGHRAGADRAIAVTALGSTPVVVPALVRPDELASLLALVAGADAAPLLEGIWWIGGPIWLVAATLLLLRARACMVASRAGAALALTATAFAMLPPLVAFALYFGLIHSPRAFLHVARESGIGPFELLKAAVWPSIAALGLLGAGWLALDDGRADDAIIRAAFIGLSALTIPHMVLATAARHAAD